MQVEKDLAWTLDGWRTEDPERSPAGRQGDAGADETSVFLGLAVTDSCDEAILHSFLLQLKFFFSPSRPPSVLHQSEETQSVVMSLRRSQPCSRAVAYSNWIRVEISSLPVRLLKFSAWFSLSSVSRRATARYVRLKMKICQIQEKCHRR